MVDKMVESNTKVEVVEISDQSQFEVAIIGGGITGLALAIGLLQRNIKFTIYERAHTFREIGAGIGFTPNAERAMNALNPALHAAFRKVAAQNDEDYFYYMDGYNYSEEDPTHEETILKLYLGERGFEGCRRPDFMAETVRLIPPEHIQLDKDLVSVADVNEDEGVHLSFRDGSTARADIGKSDECVCEAIADGGSDWLRRHPLENERIDAWSRPPCVPPFV
jgi:2-polyprenyl-6-methoxyphenol hydroxylase-like FAD-dependent oxidoreductase